ncbi:LOW QUALITY PROTEIN: hypothetical protein V1477_001519 [Vespula maculifrons]|uniref:Uncharacterized protein n=1 Tax=Vespula maculifrons TaxID=7453 RepID=A0ABD2CYM6_VESMC
MIKHSTSEVKHIHIALPVLHRQYKCPTTNQITKRKHFSLLSYIEMVNQSMLYFSNVTEFSQRFYDGDRSIATDERDIRSLNYMGSEMLDEEEQNFTSHVICHLMCQIVKAAEEADATHEFITNLANDVKPNLVRKETNYMVSENNVAIAGALLLQQSTSILNFNKRGTKRSDINNSLKVVGNYNQRRNILLHLCACCDWDYLGEGQRRKNICVLPTLERPIWQYFIKLETVVRGNGRDLPFPKDSNVSGFKCKSYGIILREICRGAVGLSLASKISPQFYNCLFTPSNIATSYGAYSRTIAENSLSLSLSGLVKPPNYCVCTSFP